MQAPEANAPRIDSLAHLPAGLLTGLLARTDETLEYGDDHQSSLSRKLYQGAGGQKLVLLSHKSCLTDFLALK